MKKEIKQNPSLTAVFKPLVEILVDENITDSTKMPNVYVTLEFGLMLRVGDMLQFDDESIGFAKWIQDCDNPEELYGECITLTYRVIHPDCISFFAKIG